MTKREAIKEARDRVFKEKVSACDYVVHTFDILARAWRVSDPMGYHTARSIERGNRILVARKLRGVETDFDPTACEGPWEGWVP